MGFAEENFFFVELEAKGNRPRMPAAAKIKF